MKSSRKYEEVAVDSAVKLIVVGAGGHGRSVAEAVMLNPDSEFELIGFIDDSWPNNKFVWEFPVLGGTSDLDAYLKQASHVIIAIGNNKLRAELQRRFRIAGFNLASIVHPRAMVSPSATIGVGSAIMAGAIIGTEANLGSGVIVNSAAVVDHHCEVGDYGHLGVGTAMAGGSRLGKGAWLQAGSALGYGESLKDWCVVS